MHPDTLAVDTRVEPLYIQMSDYPEEPLQQNLLPQYQQAPPSYQQLPPGQLPAHQYYRPDPQQQHHVHHLQHNYAPHPHRASVSSGRSSISSTSSVGGPNAAAAATPSNATVPASPPQKKKRGRPPKPSSLTNKITTTMNINVSPMSSSPTAESNSNQIVKQGVPDFFTPLMKVSPTIRGKRKRKNSLANTSPTKRKTSTPGTGSATGLALSPLSAAVNGTFATPYQVNSKAIDNISMITQSTDVMGSQSNEPVTFYNTPPSSAIKNQFPNYLSTPQFESDAKLSFATPGSSTKAYTPVVTVTASSPTPGQTALAFNKNLLPPVSLVANSPETHKQTPKKKSVSPKSKKAQPAASGNEFLLRITVDDLGKAVLSSDFFSAEPRVTKPKLTHSKSVIGIESQYVPSQSPSSADKGPVLKRHNSDNTGIASMTMASLNLALSSINETYIKNNSNASQSQQVLSSIGGVLPQTPNFKENYMYCSTGLTPNAALPFNLTPQFNSMMYSMMNINSPLKKGVNNQQFIMNQEFFVNGSQDDQQYDNESLQQLQQLQDEFYNQLQLQPQQYHETIQMTDLMNMDPSDAQHKPSHPKPSSTYDSGDARLALKKIIHVKKN